MNKKKNILIVFVLLGIIVSAYPGLCEINPFPIALFYSTPFILYGLIYPLSKTERVVIGCIAAISITLPITILSQYTIFTNCGAYTQGYSALPYFFVTIGNILIAGLSYFIALNSYFRNHENNRFSKVASFFSALGIIIMASILLFSIIEVSA